MKKLAIALLSVAIALAFSACSSGEFYELKKSPCACDSYDELAHKA